MTKRRQLIVILVMVFSLLGIDRSYAALSKTVNIAVVKAELKSITFTSDHGVLKNNNSDWTDSGTTYSEPEWVKDAGTNNPITHTKNTKITANVTVKVSPSGLNFDLIGTGSNYASFTKTGNSSSGSEQTISVTAGSNLPANITTLSETISWKIRITDVNPVFEQIVGSSGPHKIYVTAGSPYGTVVTEKRVNHVTTVCNGTSTAHSCAEKIHDSTAAYALGSATPSPIWLIAGGTPAECMDLAKFNKAGVEMLGLPAGSIVYLYPTLGYGAKETSSPGNNEIRGSDGASMYFQDYSSPPGYNNFEGAFRYDVEGMTKYYAGGALIYDTILECMTNICDKTFWDTAYGPELAEDWP